MSRYDSDGLRRVSPHLRAGVGVPRTRPVPVGGIRGFRHPAAAARLACGRAPWLSAHPAAHPGQRLGRSAGHARAGLYDADVAGTPPGSARPSGIAPPSGRIRRHHRRAVRVRRRPGRSGSLAGGIPPVLARATSTTAGSCTWSATTRSAEISRWPSSAPPSTARPGASTSSPSPCTCAPATAGVHSLNSSWRTDYRGGSGGIRVSSRPEEGPGGSVPPGQEEPAEAPGASGQYLPDSYFRIWRDATISIARITLSDSDRRSNWASRYRNFAPGGRRVTAGDGNMVPVGHIGHPRQAPHGAPGNTRNAGSQHWSRRRGHEYVRTYTRG